MLFNSPVFLYAFLPVAYFVFWSLNTHQQRYVWLTITGYVFYGFWDYRFCALMAFSTLVSYLAGLGMLRWEGRPRHRRLCLIVPVATDLALLAFFKYSGLFLDTARALSQRFGLSLSVPVFHVILPIGISFYTFEALSYTIDVYRGVIPATRSLRDYTMFVSFFPELVAGPIVRASIFMPQMNRSLSGSWRRIRGAVPIVLLGFTKKLLVADRLAVFVDPVFASPELYSRGTLATAVVAYAIQIYCDFSGYTDIAIGVARMVGFDLPENFDMPYLSTSITEFWRRWHMTLSAWLRDYLYIPLGGNRKGPGRTYVNLILTMLLGGLWHGASWTFVLWGLYHGTGLAAHKRWREWRGVAKAESVGAVAGWAATFAFVCGGWILFRAANLPIAATVFARLLGPATGGIHWFFPPFWVLLPLVVAAHAVGRATRESSTPGDGAHVGRHGYLLRLMPSGAGATAFLLTAWAVLLYLFVPLQRSPFIYFQF